MNPIAHHSTLFVLAALAWVALGSTALAAGIDVTVDRNQATVGEHIVMSVQVQGDRNATPELPNLSAFDVHNRGQSTQMQIINGAVSSSVAYNFILIPKKSGTFKIGPAKVELDGRVYRSRAFTLTIVDASEAPKEESSIFLDAKVSSLTPYVGEQVIFTWRLYRRVRLTGADASFPDFDSFSVEDIGEQKDFSTTLNGQRYDVTEIRKALFPLEAGEITLPGTSLTADVMVEQKNQRRGRNGSLFDDFFARGQAQRKILRTKPIVFQVKPLPAAPAGFSGLVGDFKINAQVSKRHLKVGESTTLTVSVSGTGNWKTIGEPDFPELTTFKIYSDRSTATESKSSQNRGGRKVFRKALVPLQEGQHTIPKLSLSYFDTKSGDYRKKYTRSIALMISPSDEAEDLKLTESRAPGLGKIAVKVLADDILPLKKNIDSLSSPNEAMTLPLFGLGILSPALLFFGLSTSLRRREREASDDSIRRRRVAWTEARAQLKELDASTEPLQGASLILRNFLGNKLNLEGGALTTVDTAERLERAGIKATLIERTTTFLSQCEQAQYAGPSGNASQLSGALRAELDALLSELHQGLGG